MSVEDLGPAGESGPLGQVDFDLAAAEPHASLYAADDASPEQDPHVTILPVTSPPPITTFDRAVIDDDMARALAAVPVEQVREQTLIQALDEVVSSARCWQQPQWRDVVLASPRYDELLTPWARMLAEHPATSWWAEPCRVDEQYVVVPSLDGEAPEVGAYVHADLARWFSHATENERVSRSSWLGTRLTVGGCWWSGPMYTPSTSRLWPTARVVDGEQNGSPANPGCPELRREAVGVLLTEDRMWEEADSVRVRVPQPARIVELTSADDWVELCRRYPLDVSASRRGAWFGATGRDGRWMIPNWAAVGVDYDGVHLPVLTYLEAANQLLEVDDDFATVIAGISPDETIWLRDLTVR